MEYHCQKAIFIDLSKYYLYFDFDVISLIVCEPKLVSKFDLGTCVRASPTEDIECCYPLCQYAKPSLKSVANHVQKGHNNGKKVFSSVVLFFSAFHEGGSEKDDIESEDFTPPPTQPTQIQAIRPLSMCLQDAIESVLTKKRKRD